MPKINKKYYRKAKADTDSALNIIKSIQQATSDGIPTSTLALTNIGTIGADPDTLVDEIIENACIDDFNDSSTDTVTDSFEALIDTDSNSDNSLAPSIESDSDSNDSLEAQINLPEGLNYACNFSAQLTEWAIENRITHVAINHLLSTLKPYHPELPTDARTLLQTPRNSNVKVVDPGHYYHFGLQYCIGNLLSRCNLKNPSIIEVFINIDGLPLSKSSNSQVYPILCSLVENQTAVDIIGIYHGYDKPKDANAFLKDFVNEAIHFTTHGISVNGATYSFKIKAFICDTPAKAFIKCTKGHSGYYSCTKCHIEGEYIKNRVCFPNVGNMRLRTDSDFRLKLQEEHHTGTSILEQIPDIDMINDFPTDPLHLYYLGVAKRLIVLTWCGRVPNKLAAAQLAKISELLINLTGDIPCEFNRKPRSLNESKRWKATEFRQFLLYTGAVVLKSILNRDQYVNFLTFHVATTILSSSKHMQNHCDYAKSLMNYFVRTFIILYGKQNVSQNVHNLLHACDDSKKFGTLEKFSAFPFENYMQNIKKLVRKHDKPLEQIIRRKSEQDRCLAHNTTHKDQNNEPQLLIQHHSGPITEYQFVNQFKKIRFRDFTLKLIKPDNCCCLNDGSLIFIRNFASNEEGSVVIGHKYVSIHDFYTKPCKSSQFGIHLVDDVLGPLENWDLDAIAYKCVKLTYKDKFVVFPSLHSH